MPDDTHSSKVTFLPSHACWHTAVKGAYLPSHACACTTLSLFTLQLTVPRFLAHYFNDVRYPLFQPAVGPGFLHRADVAKAMFGYNPEEKFYDLDLWMRINTLFGPRHEEQGKTYGFCVAFRS